MNNQITNLLRVGRATTCVADFYLVVMEFATPRNLWKCPEYAG